MKTAQTQQKDLSRVSEDLQALNQSLDVEDLLPDSIKIFNAKIDSGPDSARLYETLKEEQKAPRVAIPLKNFETISNSEKRNNEAATGMDDLQIPDPEVELAKA